MILYIPFCLSVTYHISVLHCNSGDFCYFFFFLDIPPSSSGLDIFRCLVQSHSSSCPITLLNPLPFTQVLPHPYSRQSSSTAWQFWYLSQSAYFLSFHSSPELPSCNHHLHVKLRTHAVNHIFKTRFCFKGRPAFKLSWLYCSSSAAAVENGSCCIQASERESWQFCSHLMVSIHLWRN